jgi:N-glycosylase/DNA lyase
MITARKLRETVAVIAREVHFRVWDRIPPSAIPERSLWLELSACILSSQVPYELALAAAQRIDVDGALRSDPSRRRELVAAHLVRLLVQPFDVGGRQRRYRFPNARATQLAATWQLVHTDCGSLGGLVATGSDVESIRTWLVSKFPGVGPKQASMFLRNTGLSYDVAVLDRHVSRYMLLVGLCETSPSNLQRLAVYKDHERTLRRYADTVGYSVGVVDWAIWIVMRAMNSLGKS